MNPTLHPLTLTETLRLLSAELSQTLSRQVLLPGSPIRGGWISAEHGLDEHGSGAAVLGAVFTVLWGCEQQTIPLPMPEPDLLRHADAALDYLLGIQDENGLFDLKSCNYSSSPDAAFAVHRLGIGMWLARDWITSQPQWAQAWQKALLFLRRACEGMFMGGFHTPNHRWVICGALAIAQVLLPDLPIKSVMRSYLAEGMDVDADGAFTEHSTGVYDAICNLCLLLAAQFGYDEVLPAVKANLDFNAYMIYPDGSAETGLSHRQDLGTRPVPLDLGAAYLLAQAFTPDPLYDGMANLLWKAKEHAGLMDLLWLVYALHVSARTPDSAVQEPQQYARVFSANRFWRARAGRFSVSVFGGSERLLCASYGGAYVSALSISQSYFGVGRFAAEDIQPVQGGVELVSSGEGHAVHRPGYDFPLGHAVTDVYASRAEREWRPLPPARTRLRITQQMNGVELRMETIDNYPGVLAQIALDFAPGGIWECEGGSFAPQAGQVIFLTGGMGRMIYGTDVLEVGPGADAHRYWHMRDTPPAPHAVRVVIPLMTPVDHRMTIRGFLAAGG